MDTGKMDGFDALFYAAVFDRLQTNIYILDVDTDTIVYMNEAMKASGRQSLLGTAAEGDDGKMSVLPYKE